MPVLFKDSRPEGACGPAISVETLVTEVRDRLCLKSQERFFPGKRTMPYQRSIPCNACKCAKKLYSSPVSMCQKRMRHRQSDLCHSCSVCQKTDRPQTTRNIEDARTMLEKLLAEQSLIQEAVRRLQSQKLKSPSSNSRSRARSRSGSRSASKERMFSFANFDSSERSPGGFTPSYSESEDDSLSQHSVDL